MEKEIKEIIEEIKNGKEAILVIRESEDPYMNATGGDYDEWQKLSYYDGSFHLVYSSSCEIACYLTGNYHSSCSGCPAWDSENGCMIDEYSKISEKQAIEWLSENIDNIKIE